MMKMIRMSLLGLSMVALSLASGCGGGSESEAKAAAVPGNGSPAATKKGSAGKVLAQAPSRGPEHSVYSLIDNRLSAHLVRNGGLLVSGSSDGFYKYLRFRFDGPGFKVKDSQGDAMGATLNGSTKRLKVPLTANQASGDVRMRVHIYNGKNRRIGFRVNGVRKKEVTVQMASGWATGDVTIAEGVFHAGENEIIIFSSRGAPTSVGWIEIGGAGSELPTPAFYDPGKKALVLPRAGGFAYYVMVPKNGLVTGDLDDASCKVNITATPDKGKAVTGTLLGRGSAVDLSALAGTPVRLELIAEGCDQALLTNAGLVVPGKAKEYTKPSGAKPKYVVLWIMDSLRADRVRTFVKGARPEVPAFDALAKTSVVFTRAYVQGNESKASHASIWSSLYPGVHRYYQKAKKHKHPALKIDKFFKDQGFYVSGESGNGYVVGRRGFGNSWDHMKNHIHEGGGVIGDDIMNAGLATLEGKKDPWFFYLGTIDTHVAWKAKKPWIDKYDPGYKGRFLKRASGHDVGLIATKVLKISKRDEQRISALYDSNVSFQDDLLRQMLEKFEAWGIADETMLIITADHGDELFEVGRVGHGSSLRETVLHVPLLIHYPPMFAAGRIDTNVELIDIVPTLADVFGQKPDDRWQGESLLPIVHKVGVEYPRMAFASQYEERYAARIGDWKLRYMGRRTKFFDLNSEPAEMTDVKSKNPVAYQMVSDALWIMQSHADDWKKVVWGNPANVSSRYASDQNE